MGIYKRADSPYYWMLIERPRQKAIRQSTGILVKALTAEQTKENRRNALLAYHDAMGNAAKLRLDLPDAKAGRTFDQHAKWYLSHYSAHRKRDSQAREETIIAHLRRLLGTDDLRAIDQHAAAEYVTRRLKEGVAASTVNRETNTLKSILRAAVPRYLRTNPLVGMKRLPHRTARNRVVFDHEEKALIAHLDGETRDLYIVSVDTLMRQQNAVHLRRREVRGDHLALEDSKTGPYTVPLSDRARAILTKRRGEWMFPEWHERFQEYREQWSVILNKQLRRAAKAAGIPVDGTEGRFCWHIATRATGATRMIRAGVDVRQVQAIGNWQSLDQMMTYLGLQAGAGHDAVNRIASTSQSRDTDESS